MSDTTNAAQAEVSQRQILTAGFASVIAWSSVRAYGPCRAFSVACLVSLGGSFRAR